jgi:hypothetical protein
MGDLAAAIGSETTYSGGIGIGSQSGGLFFVASAMDSR